ncbi:MAG: FAD-dependent oxidoreductase [Rhodobacteraceae bacterium]|nr:FAD-dependent oxidoreductase [Paracoccaceae bacterium]
MSIAETAGADLASAASAPEGAAGAVIVVGGGPCGVRVAQALSARGRDVVIFNAEAWDPYNRVKLTPLLAGDVQIGDVYLSPEFEGPGSVRTETGLRVAAIDPDAKRVTSADGRVWPYESLVLATGSTPFVPRIDGRERAGVYTFRDASDTSALLARSFSARKVVVIGGGLLGLEAARGMHRRGCKITVVEHENRLMPRQLDEAAAEELKRRIEALGVDVAVGARVAEITGRHNVTGVKFANDEWMACDTVIICTGVCANAELAKETGLNTGKGVLVDDKMRTSDPSIYAIGECAEHRGVVYGLVGPGLEQAEAAAAAIDGEQGAQEYVGTAPASKLKVIGAEVFSAGPVEDLEERRNVRSHVWRNEDGYRRIFIERGKLVGAIGVGEWPEASRFQQAIADGMLIYPWMLYRFRREGGLWRPSEGGAETLPASAIVCNCTGVKCGRIRDCMQLGASSLEEIRRSTGANTVCGSCAGLIDEILSGGKAPPKPVRMWRPLLWLSGIGAGAATLTAAAPAVPLPDAYAAAPLLEALWFDNVWKQWSGYTLLAVTLAAMALGLRKRIGLFRRLGGYDWWRIAHLGIGVAAVAVLFAHTGFRFGANLTSVLMISFVATLVFGALAGLATGGDHKLREQGIGDADTPPRVLPVWLHVIALWPLPVLLLAHILSIYVY